MANIADLIHNGVDMTYPTADDKERVKVDKEYAKAKRLKGRGRKKWYQYDSILIFTGVTR